MKSPKLLRYILLFFAGFIFAVLCFVVLNLAMEPVSKSEYCGTKCHEMNTAYESWELSAHGANIQDIRVECIDCHLPSRDKFFTHTVAKAYYGVKDIYKHYFGGEYDFEQFSEKVLATLPDEYCVSCHDDLLKKPSDLVVQQSHAKSLESTDEKYRCLECHEDTGHKRKDSLSLP